jgi:DNA-directed RNA polymerase subunit RPC12/RpoP
MPKYERKPFLNKLQSNPMNRFPLIMGNPIPMIPYNNYSQRRYFNGNNNKRVNKNPKNNQNVHNNNINNNKNNIINLNNQQEQINSNFYCSIHNQSFQTKEEYDNHLIYKHNIYNLIQCPKCSKIFESKNKLKIHNKKEHEFLCQFCSRKFVSNQGLTSHMLTHQNECKICHKLFSNQQKLIEHNNIHLNTNFKCNICNESFETNEELINHNNNNNHSLYKCNNHNKTFKSKEAYLNHCKSKGENVN